jgi:Carboxypeptidase regulatory-like domain
MPKIKMSFRRFAVWIMILAFWTYLPKRANADSNTANLSVSVSDSSGALIPGAHLALRNTDTNQEQQIDSGKTGSVTFTFLKAGHYALTVSKDGFADIVVDHIVLNVGDEKRLQLSLKIGNAAQTINVDGSGLSINTTDASVSTVVDRKFVENIPLNGRSFQDLISLTPGVVTQSPQSGSSIAYNGDFSVNGQRTESNYYTVDGVSGNNSAGNGYGQPQAGTSGALGGSTALGTTQSLISVDALQEFRVQSSSYSAEYGRSPGGQFSLATRSGTNQLHGSIFDYIRNNYFDANDWFNDHYGDALPALRQNDFGGTLGGPITIPHLYDGKSKSFFFVSYEGLRLAQPQAASIQYVPDTNLRQNAPAAIQSILNAYPIQNGLDYGNGLAQFIAPYSLPSQLDSTSIRLDHTVNPKTTLFFRAGYTPSTSSARSLSSLATTSMNAQSYTLGATSQVLPSITNQFRIGYTWGKSSVSQRLDNFGGATPIDLASTMGLGNAFSTTAVFQIYIPSVGDSLLQTANPVNRSKQWNVVDTVDISMGHHQLKFGVDYRRIDAPLTPQSPTADAVFESSRSVLNNAADILILEKINAAAPVFNEFSSFVQDEWQISQNLHLSGGIRWEINPPPTEAHGHDAYTALGSLSDPSSLQLAPEGTPLWKTTWYNFAPRLGLAWTAHHSVGWETVLRSGGGVFFDTDNQLATNGYAGIGFLASQFLFGASVPVSATELQFSPSAAAPYTSAPVYAFPSHLQLPYALEWNASLEQALGKSQAVTISYVASNGRRLLQQQNLSLSSVNSNFGTVIFVPNGVTSNYQALQVQFQRSISHGVQALGSYTWSHSLDYGSTDSAQPLTRGNSDFDVRNSLQAGLSWDLPGLRGNRILRAAGSDWGLDGRFIVRTSFPITLEGNYLTDPATGSQYYGNVNLVPNEPVYLYGSQYPGGRAINPSAFTTPSGSGAGDAPRNFVRGFGAEQINLAVRRTFPLHDRLSLQFRAETFNLLNHPNFGYVDPYFYDATFGEATKMLNQSLGTVASQYQQGGPRSMQFALKAVF